LTGFCCNPADAFVKKHGLINFIDTNAKCRHLTKINLHSDFPAGVYLSEAPPPLTLYAYHTGKGRRDEPERRLEGQQFTKLGRKYQHDWLYLQTINSDKTPAAKSLYRSIFLDEDI
jgi:hypothetical protein